MYRKLIYSFSLVLSLSIPTYQANASYPFLQDSDPDGTVSMEAEHYDAKVPALYPYINYWTLITSSAGASGSEAMQALPNDKTTISTGYVNNSPRMDFKVSFVKTGKHYVWVRGNASGDANDKGGDDSCHVGLDNQVTVPYIDFNTPKAWDWFNGRTDGTRATFYVPSAGVHTVNIWMRESGAIVDKIVLTTDVNYVPSGDGPEESTRAEVVDDFENYSATNRIFETWLPGSGTGAVIGHLASPYVEQTTVYSGGKSMPYYYNNNQTGKAHYSEAEADTANLGIGADWTKDNIKALALHYYGAPTNAATVTERMYVALKDDANKIAVVFYDGDPNDIRDPNWHEWNIRLKDFNDVNGVNLNNVKKVYIGFGDRNTHPTPSGSGLVYFDDIRLYPSRCVPSRVKGNFNDDCVVDYADLEIMTADWLNDYQFENFAWLAESWLAEILWP